MNFFYTIRQIIMTIIIPLSLKVEPIILSFKYYQFSLLDKVLNENKAFLFKRSAILFYVKFKYIRGLPQPLGNTRGFEFLL